ncbi:MAG: LamG domain-containing protein [Chloroflexota bacterium]|nr:MAG: LamG domain-containing protein [Chloroflexota bacterium]
MNRSTVPSAEERIRQWLAVGPERGSERAIDATIDRLRETRQPRMLTLRLPLSLVAAVAILAVVVGGAGLFIGLRPGPASIVAPSPSPNASACSLEIAVGGRWPILLGRGFGANADVVLVLDRADGSHTTITVTDRGELRTDAGGRFGLELPPSPEDLGRLVISASAGCTASVETIITADQLPPACPDPAVGPMDLRDGPGYRAVVAGDAPVHLWHLDEAREGTAIDATGGADGTWIGTPAGVTGSTGTGALFFDGSGSYVEIPRLAVDDFTVEAWVYLCDGVDNADAIVGHSLEAPSLNFFDYRLRLFTAELGDVVVASSPATLDRWQHWAVTRDATGTRIYLDGVLDATGGPWSGEMVIDQIGRGDAGFLCGLLDELAIYDRALTAEALTSHATAR